MNKKYNYASADIDYRAHPELYKIAKGEQGVLIVEPYKSEILPHWKFKTAIEANISAQMIYKMFLAYKDAHDFVGMDMARKYLQMGYTRSRRYARHKSGKKYGSLQDKENKKELPETFDPEKQKSADIFWKYYQKAINDVHYLEYKRIHKDKYG
ncbi:DUF4385 domain-containing protein [Vermiphilus pyriformis]|nr:MAG: DUF4385 domain-containing protein [Vermiphilus pyriformis]